MFGFVVIEKCLVIIVFIEKNFCLLRVNVCYKFCFLTLYQEFKKTLSHHEELQLEHEEALKRCDQLSRYVDDQKKVRFFEGCFINKEDLRF